MMPARPVVVTSEQTFVSCRFQASGKYHCQRSIRTNATEARRYGLSSSTVNLRPCDVRGNGPDSSIGTGVGLTQ
jgi:hypothetical protein